MGEDSSHDRVNQKICGFCWMVLNQKPNVLVACVNFKIQISEYLIHISHFRQKYLRSLLTLR